jgi:hypothetical protein
VTRVGETAVDETQGRGTVADEATRASSLCDTATESRAGSWSGKGPRPGSRPPSVKSSRHGMAGSRVLPKPNGKSSPHVKVVHAPTIIRKTIKGLGPEGFKQTVTRIEFSNQASVKATSGRRGSQNPMVNRSRSGAKRQKSSSKLTAKG